ncbi:MAG: glucosamine-6-phosphate deaminase [Coriobacteriia bacterium]|nr:glucosamine-6-phosphate deaminase [Coriobacteriia bacterium]MCL2745622.1 glucosamine-6-phosphate deaminase [Coriobacteriia bacterium]MCL2871347.1 glucosamine-6-phosphate deaminase [Coriobacteriia bacterium]
MSAPRTITLDNITVYIEANDTDVGKRAADVFCTTLTQAPNAAYGFATGSTPVCLYKELIARYKAGLLDMSGITAFNLDEYYPITKENDQSYDYFMSTELFNHVNVKPENRDIPSGEAPDPEAECLRYEKAIRTQEDFKLQILGIGENGHIGFNEPASTFPAKTNYVELTESTIAANARFFESAADVPKHALTMGVGTIMMAEQVLLIATGPKKSRIVYESLLGSIDPQVSASALQMHRNVTVVLDTDAAHDLLANLDSVS